jgi:hypothetical protein
MDKARGVRRRKHTRISAELTALTQSWLPGRSPVNDEYGDLVAIAQRHILPTATKHSGEATNIALIDDAAFGGTVLLLDDLTSLRAQAQ